MAKCDSCGEDGAILCLMCKKCLSRLGVKRIEVIEVGEPWRNGNGKGGK